MSLVAGSLGGGMGRLGMVPIAARARARSPAEPLGETGDGPNARCVAIRTRRASKFIPRSPSSRATAPKKPGEASNPNQP